MDTVQEITRKLDADVRLLTDADLTERGLRRLMDDAKGIACLCAACQRQAERETAERARRKQSISLRRLMGKIIVTERMRKAAIDKYYSWTSHRYAGDDIFDEEVAEAVFTAMMDASDA